MRRVLHITWVLRGLMVTRGIVEEVLLLRPMPDIRSLVQTCQIRS